MWNFTKWIMFAKMYWNLHHQLYGLDDSELFSWYIWNFVAEFFFIVDLPWRPNTNIVDTCHAGFFLFFFVCRKGNHNEWKRNYREENEQKKLKICVSLNATLAELVCGIPLGNRPYTIQSTTSKPLVAIQIQSQA